jgi:hypothetical protein
MSCALSNIDVNYFDNLIGYVPNVSRAFISWSYVASIWKFIYCFSKAAGFSDLSIAF